MKIIKEYCPNPDMLDTGRVAIRTDCYVSNLDHIQMLFKVAQNDFGSFLTPDLVKIVIYGGQRYKGILGIEFNVAPAVVPKEYERVTQLEYTL